MTTDAFDKAARAVEAAANTLGLQAGGLDDKAVVIARIRSRRGHLAKAVGADAAAEPGAAPQPASRRDVAAVVPVAAQLLPSQDRPFPRSTTMRVLLQHPLAATLGAVLIWKAGPTRLLVVGRLLLPLVRHTR